MNEKIKFENINKIGVVSDLHIPLNAKKIPKIIIERFKQVDLILIAGDIVTIKPIQELEKLAPVVAVHGNMDYPELASKLPTKIIIEVNNFKIGLTHSHGSPDTTTQNAKAMFNNVDCIVFGHSHQPMNEIIENTLMFNPGSATGNRLTNQNTFGILTINNQITGEILNI
jgi:uncharacterized protein